MGKVVNFNKEQRSSRELLDSAIEKDFDEIVLVGWKDGSIYVRTTGLNDIAKSIGGLEIIKEHLFATWD